MTDARPDVDAFDILATAKATFREQLAGRLTAIPVPAWALTIYWRPPTMAQRAKWNAITAAGSLVEAIPDLIVMRACTQDGAPMFSRAHLVDFRERVDSEILMQIGTRILELDAALFAESRDAGAVDPVEVAAKN